MKPLSCTCNGFLAVSRCAAMCVKRGNLRVGHHSVCAFFQSFRAFPWQARHGSVLPCPALRRERPYRFCFNNFN